jgi:hypothetical protein
VNFDHLACIGITPLQTKNILGRVTQFVNHDLIIAQSLSYPSTKANRGIASESKQERLERNTEIYKGHNESDYE